MKWDKAIVHLDDGTDATMFVQRHPFFDTAPTLVLLEKKKILKGVQDHIINSRRKVKE